LPITVNAGTPPNGGVVSTATNCTGNASGTLTLSGHSGTITKWQYQNSGDVLWNDVSNVTTSLSYSGVTSTRTYRAELTNVGCGTATSTGGVVTIATTPVVTGVAHAVIGSSSQLTSSTGNTGATWGSSNSSIASVNSTGLVTPVSVGTANITYSSNVGCVGNVVLFSSNPPIPPTISTPSNITSNCGGISNGPVNFTVGDTDATALTALVVTASSSNTALIPNANITITQPNVSGASSFVYTPVAGQTGTSTITLTVTDQDGLTATTSFTITVNTSTISAVSNVINDLSCGSTTTGSVTTTITGGTGYTYQWAWAPLSTGPWSTSFTSPFATPSPSVSPTNLLGGYYYRLTVTDACGTTITSSPILVGSVNAMAVTATPTNITCYGASTGSMTVNTTNGGTSQVVTAVSGSNTYTQSVSTGTSSARTFVLSNLPAGTYTVSVADANSSCNPSTTVTITQPAQLAISGTQTNVVCNGASTGSINLTVGATGSTSATPVTFLWSNAATTEDLSNLAAGTYSVTATNACSQTATASFTITQPAILAATVTAVPVSVCYGNNNGSLLTPNHLIKHRRLFLRNIKSLNSSFKT
jgi:hypothetical protein